jgi:hypothetical protein
VQLDPNESQALYTLARALAKRNDPEAQQYRSRFEELQKSQIMTDRATLLRRFGLGIRQGTELATSNRADATGDSSLWEVPK